jgi:hypothetical protein
VWTNCAKENLMSHLSPSFDRFPIQSAVPAVQWRRQWDLEDAARYRLAAEAARSSPRRSRAPVLSTLGSALVRAGERISSFGANSTAEPATRSDHRMPRGIDAGGTATS